MLIRPINRHHRDTVLGHEGLSSYKGNIEARPVYRDERNIAKSMIAALTIQSLY